jgi:hypothetical protein
MADNTITMIEDFTGMLLPLGFGALFVTVIVWLIRKARQSVRANAELLQRLGFQEVPVLEPEIEHGIAELLRRSKQPISILNVHKGRRMGYDLYRFRAMSRNSDDNGSFFYAIVDSSRQLPRFSVGPNVGLPSVIGKVFNSIIDKVASGLGLIRVNLTECRSFSTKYMLFAKSREDVLNALSPDLWERFADTTEFLTVDAEGAILVFQCNLVLARNRKRGPSTSFEADLKAHVDMAERLRTVFSHVEMSRSL